MEAFILIGLGYGDEGKGTITDYLARQHSNPLVIRFNGGCQAAHNVVDGRRHHTFAQFGSGTLAGADSYLSRFMMVNPLNMMAEARGLRELNITDAFERTFIDEKALVTTPFHRAANRLRECERGRNRHGSCGMGIGETARVALDFGDDALRVGDLLQERTLRRKLALLQEEFFCNSLRDLAPGADHALKDEMDSEVQFLSNPNSVTVCIERYGHFSRVANFVDQTCLAEAARKQTLLFEGAQGILLDEWYGFHPYTTWSTTTSRNAETLLSEIDYQGQVTKIGVVRSYTTRHGPGPLVSEDPQLARALPEPHNHAGPWQGDFRVGWLDLVATRYALKATGHVDALAVTHMDALQKVPKWFFCDGYQHGVSGAVIPEIYPPPSPSLSHQEDLAQVLIECKPMLCDVSTEPSAYLRKLETQLSACVVIASHGPRPQDKLSLMITAK